MPDEPEQLGQRRAVKAASLAEKFAAPQRSETLRGLITQVATETPVATSEPKDTSHPPTTDEPRPGKRTERTGRRDSRSGQSTGASVGRAELRGQRSARATGQTKKLEIKATQALKRQLEETATRLRKTVTAIIFEAIDELHDDLPALIEAHHSRTAQDRVVASAGSLFPRRVAERGPREPKAVITIRASEDELDTMDRLTVSSNAENRSFMITVLVGEWLTRRLRDEDK